MKMWHTIEKSKILRRPKKNLTLRDQKSTKEYHRYIPRFKIMTGTLNSVVKVLPRILNKDFQKVDKNLLKGLRITSRICTKLSIINYQDSKTNFTQLKMQHPNE